MKYEFTLLLEPQKEGGFTITCEELPELVTECDSIEEIEVPVLDALDSVVDLYEQKQWVIPQREQHFNQPSIVRDNPLLRTVVIFNEVSRNKQKAQAAWM